MTNTQTRQPRGIPSGGQFSTSAHTESCVSLVTVPAQRIEVQAEPLLADASVFSRLAADGSLTSVVSLPIDEWDGCRNLDARSDLLARTQIAHVEPFWLDHEILAIHDGNVLVQVTNNLHAWAQDDDAIDNYNAEVAPGYAITPEKRAWLSASGHTAPNGGRVVYDLDNHLVTWSAEGPSRVTPCCGASATGTGDYVGCRACYEPVDDAIGTRARLVAQHGPAVSWGSARVQEDERESVQRAIDVALQAAMTQTRVVKPRYWEDHVVVVDDRGRARVFNDSAWETPASRVSRGAEQPMLPRPDAPQSRVVARVSHDGHVDVSDVTLGLTGLRQRVDGRFEHNGSLRQARHQCTRPNTGATCVLMQGHPDECTPKAER